MLKSHLSARLASLTDLHSTEKILSVDPKLLPHARADRFSDEELALAGCVCTLTLKHDVAQTIPSACSIRSACSGNHSAVARYICTKYRSESPRVRTLFGWSVNEAVRLACELGHMETVVEIAGHGWNVSTEDKASLLLKCGKKSLGFSASPPSDAQQVLGRAALFAIERGMSSHLAFLLPRLSVRHSAVIVVTALLGNEEAQRLVLDTALYKAPVKLDREESCLLAFAPSSPLLDYCTRPCHDLSPQPGWGFVRYVYAHFGTVPESVDYNELAMDAIREGNSAALDFICSVADVNFEDLLSSRSSGSMESSLRVMGYANRN